MKLARLTLVTALLMTAPAYGQSNPCNPCGGKMKANPCGGKMEANPCDGKMMVNPCDAKMGIVFHVNDPAGRNSITFRSEAPLEDIVGTSNQVTGYLVFDPSNPKKGGRGELTVPVASLNTGIPLRNEHVQSADWLNAARYPHITLRISDVRGMKKVKSSGSFQTYEVTVVGQFALHGKSKTIEFPGRITYMKESEKTREKMPGNLLAARASFEIPLSAFGITGPKGAGLVGSKVGQEIGIEVSLVGSSEMTMAGNPCNPCGGKAQNPCNPCGGKGMNPCNPCGM